MYTSQDIKKGMIFETQLKNKLTILDFNEDFITVQKDYASKLAGTKKLNLNINIFLRDWNRGIIKQIVKPLDQAFKDLDMALASDAIKHCSHRNIRRDVFFTSRVFLTCCDCGKPLN